MRPCCDACGYGPLERAKELESMAVLRTKAQGKTKDKV